MTIDESIGRRIRARRIELGLSQAELAEKISTRSQQVHKYEYGHTRISASRLWNIAVSLEIPVSYFFEDADQPQPLDPEIDRDARAIAELLRGMGEEQRRALLRLVHAMGGGDLEAALMSHA